MLSQESFNSLSKAQLCNIYIELYQKNEEREQIIIDYVKRSSMGNTGSQFSYHKVTGNKANDPEKVRTIKVIPLPERTGNLILGSSIVKNMAGNRTIPTDIVTHAYRGSTTSEKIQILDQYPNRKMKTVVLQDGTNTIVKNKDKPIDEIFDEYQVLLDKVREKFSPDILVALEVPPMKNDPRNTSKNTKIQEFNNILREKACSMGIKVAPIHQTITSFPNYNFLYYDDLHFHNYRGVPFLKNFLLSYVLCTSDGQVQNSVTTRNHQNHNYWANRRTYSNDRNYWQQSYNYMGY